MKIFVMVLLMLTISITAKAYDVSQAYKDVGIVLGRKIKLKEICGPNGTFGKRVDNNEERPYTMIKCEPKSKDITRLMVAHLAGVPVWIGVSYAEKRKTDGKKIEFNGGFLLSDNPYNADQGGRNIIGAIATNVTSKISNINFSAVWVALEKDDNVRSFDITDCAMDYSKNYMQGMYKNCQEIRQKLTK